MFFAPCSVLRCPAFFFSARPCLPAKQRFPDTPLHARYAMLRRLSSAAPTPAYFSSHGLLAPCYAVCVAFTLTLTAAMPTRRHHAPTQRPQHGAAQSGHSVCASAERRVNALRGGKRKRIPAATDGARRRRLFSGMNECRCHAMSVTR